MHHDQKELINILNISALFFNKKIPVYLINATIQKVSLKYIKIFHKFKKIYVRENLSKIFLNKYGISSKVVPDLIFYKKTTDSIFKKNNNILITDSTINRDTKKLFDLYNQFKNNAVFVPLFFFLIMKEVN